MLLWQSSDSLQLYFVYVNDRLCGPFLNANKLNDVNLMRQYFEHEKDQLY